jgi:hypothetical protein
MASRATIRETITSSIGFFMVHVLSVLVKTFGDLSYGKLLTVK